VKPFNPPAAASHAHRLPLIDAARGVAVVAMVVYHLSWDLRYFGYITAEVETEFGWRMFARAIAGTFLFLVGVGLVLSTRRGFDLRAFLRRLGIIVAAAAAITLATWFVFRDTFIFFGMLHHIAVASVLGLAFLRLPVWLVLGAALFCFVVPPFFAGPAFDDPALIWLGLASALPRTNDFVPLLPWFGVVLAGIAAARLWPLYEAYRPALQRLGDRTPWQLLWLGRHSLPIYLLHQPILFGVVYLAAQVAPPNLLSFEPQYLESCTTFCVEAEVDPDVCRRTCECTAERVQLEGFWNDLMRQALNGEDEQRYFAIADACRAESGGN
jgi:uncharacterized membrane protein